MRKYFTTLSLAVLTVILFSCNNKNSKENNTQTPVESSGNLASKVLSANELDSIVSLIIDISAKDFYKNQQPAPVNFSDVKLKYIKKQNGEELYILCGRFITIDKQETPFATVKNIDYEQWVGTSALTYCQDSKEILYTKSDLSSALKTKFESLKK